MPAPGAVWPAIVILGLVIRMSPRMTPLTSKTTIRGPSAAQASARLPGPDAFRLVTLMTLPPRPPLLIAPQPSAPGKALSEPASGAASAESPFAETATRQPHTRARVKLRRVLTMRATHPGKQPLDETNRFRQPRHRILAVLLVFKSNQALVLDLQERSQNRFRIQNSPA